jgi:hypothetical protein
MTKGAGSSLLSIPEPQPGGADQPLLLQPSSASEANSATAPPAGATTTISLTIPAEVAGVAQQVLAKVVDEVGSLAAPAAAAAPSRSHPAAQAQMAGVLQGLGTKYKDRRMLEAGQQLEHQARGLPDVPPKPRRPISKEGRRGR